MRIRAAEVTIGALVLAVLLPGPASAEPLDTSSQLAVDLLAGSIVAAHSLAYRGEQLCMQWSRDGSTSVVLMVAHVPGRGSVVAPVPTAAGSGPSLVEPAQVDRQTEVLAAANLAVLTSHYVVTLAGVGRVLSRPADVVIARRADGSVAARFWVDARTGLLLRRDLYDDAGRMLASTGFLDLVVGSRPGAASPRVVDVAVPTPWLVTPPVPDRRYVAPDSLAGLSRIATREGTVNGARVLSVEYSDGLTEVSVFEQPGRLDPAAVRGWRPTRIGHQRVWTSAGIPTRMIWAGPGLAFTAVSDGPAAVLDRVVAALPHSRPSRGFFGRIAHGLGRILDWLNPF